MGGGVVGEGVCVGIEPEYGRNRYRISTGRCPRQCALGNVPCDRLYPLRGGTRASPVPILNRNPVYIGDPK
jgi:hypothetical protein